ncbi:MAG: NfeD family protein [bacterium]|nr:NfeD family protein [bacterium]
MIWVLTVAALGLLCIFAEVFLPGGVLGVLGWLLIGTSFVGAYHIWRLSGPFVLFVACIVGAGVALYVIAIKLMPKTAVGKMLFLQNTQKGYDVSISGQRELIGKEGIALSFLRPSGIAEIDGKRVNVIAEGEFIERDTWIRVSELKDNQLVVHRVEQDIRDKTTGGQK